MDLTNDELLIIRSGLHRELHACEDAIKEYGEIYPWMEKSARKHYDEICALNVKIMKEIQRTSPYRNGGDYEAD